MNWNLVDNVPPFTSDRRRFYPPLASIPPSESGSPDSSLSDRYSFEVHRTPDDPGPAETTSDIRLDITIEPGGSGGGSGSLPDPAGRLHAMDAGKVYFKPAEEDGMGDRLVLDCLTFNFLTGTSLTLESNSMLATAFNALVESPLLGGVAWWGQWEDADCIPDRVIYENVDRDTVEDAITAINVDGSSYGLTFPNEVVADGETPDDDEITKSDFVANFMSGDEGHFVTAKPGAYLGEAGDADEGSDDNLLQLHARYEYPGDPLYPGHAEDDPHPMNPVELLYLLFGDDSTEANDHPLLQAVDDSDTNQVGDDDEIESKTMALRPPLRTWKRVMWECELEEDEHQSAWEVSGDLDPDASSDGDDRIYNNLQRDWDCPWHTDDEHEFNDSSYENSYKCNIFVYDLALRSGFRTIGVDQGSGPMFNYQDSNHTADIFHEDDAFEDDGSLKQYAAYRGDHHDDNMKRRFATKLEGLLLSTDADDREDTLTDRIETDGRCMVVVGYRGNVNDPSDGTGHIVLVNDITGEPVLQADLPADGDIDIDLEAGNPLPGETVEFIATSKDDGTPIDGGDVTVNGDDEGATAADGTFSLTLPDPDDNEFTVEVTSGDDTGTREWTIGAGIRELPMDSYEAGSTNGAYTRTGDTFELSGVGGNNDTPHNFEYLHLFELEPGLDPDTEQGMEDLNLHAHTIEGG